MKPHICKDGKMPDGWYIKPSEQAKIYGFTLFNGYNTAILCDFSHCPWCGEKLVVEYESGWYPVRHKEDGGDAFAIYNQEGDRWSIASYGYHSCYTKEVSKFFEIGPHIDLKELWDREGVQR